MTNSPRDLLVELFPSLNGHIPISGGWGIRKEDVCRIECGSTLPLGPEQECSPWETISIFVEKRVYFLLIINQPDGNKHSGISWRLIECETIIENEITYAVLDYEVSYFLDNDWEKLKLEWDGPDGIRSHNFDMDDHNRRRAELQITNIHRYWFDISQCYSMSIYGFHLPLFVSDFARGKTVNYEYKEKGFGYGVEYRQMHNTADAEATIYLYQLGDSDIPDDCNDEKIIKIFHNSIDEVISINTDVYKRTCVVVRHGVYTFSNVGDFLCAEIDVFDGQKKRKSYLFFRGINGYYFKARITLDAEEEFQQMPFMLIRGLLIN